MGVFTIRGSEELVRVASVSIIIPTFNGASRIGNCLSALMKQTSKNGAEILVVNDGSTDRTDEVVAGFPAVQLISQANAGPAAARNRGAQEASGEILLFTDDDCVPTNNWLEAMLEPFRDPEVVGSKGVYRTHQTQLAARFVQVEYEDRYRIMTAHPDIDFIDTYSAAFRRDRFLEMGGYDTSFPVACAEDIELSYRMSARGWKMKFIPSAIVYHTHPDTFWKYFKKKYKFAFWRVLAVRKNPKKGVKDSHTPQIMKLQLLFAPALFFAVAADLWRRSPGTTSAIIMSLFLVSTIPFTMRALSKDFIVGLLAPVVLAGRACAQFFGVLTGLVRAKVRSVRVVASSTA